MSDPSSEQPTGSAAVTSPHDVSATWGWTALLLWVAACVLVSIPRVKPLGIFPVGYGLAVGIAAGWCLPGGTVGSRPRRWGQRFAVIGIMWSGLILIAFQAAARQPSPDRPPHPLARALWEQMAQQGSSTSFTTESHPAWQRWLIQRYQPLRFSWPSPVPWCAALVECLLASAATWLAWEGTRWFAHHHHRKGRASPS
ncbi:MAG: hypothetical protein KatS3mg114_1322 [Planctomycetaceae bacterium]|nr:MAG: hypothetical protein KatS3mg114_1322 [Planctomycetaceae bacterium]